MRFNGSIIATQNQNAVVDVRQVRYYAIEAGFPGVDGIPLDYCIVAHWSAKENIIIARYHTEDRAMDILREFSYTLRNGEAYDYKFPEQ